VVVAAVIRASRRRKLVVAALVFAGLTALPYGITDVYLQNVLILTSMPNHGSTP
jgi:branched-chain amino acid transport system permease protein